MRDITHTTLANMTRHLLLHELAAPRRACCAAQALRALPPGMRAGAGGDYFAAAGARAYFDKSCYFQHTPNAGRRRRCQEGLHAAGAMADADNR